MVDASVQGNAQVAIKVNNISYTIPENQNKTTLAILNDAQPKVWDKTTGQPIANSGLTIDKESDIQSAQVAGPIKVTVSYQGASAKFVVNIKDQTTMDDSDHHVAIDAKDFNYDLANVSQLGHAGLVKNAKIKAWDTNTGDLINSVTLTPDTLIDKKVVGNYKVSVSANGSKAKVFNVNLYDNNTGYDTGNAQTAKNFVYADNFTLNSLEDAEALNEESAKTNAHVNAWASDGTSLTGSVTVNTAQLQAIQTTKQLGAYPLTFTVNGASKEVVVSVKDANTQTSGDGSLNISAKDVEVNLSEAKNFKQEVAKQRASAHAWLTNSTDPVTNITIQNFENITNAKTTGTVNITFVARHGDQRVSKQVTVTLTDNLVYEIVANDFAVSSNKVKLTEFNADQVKTLSQVKVMAQGNDYSAEQLSNVAVNEAQLNVIKQGNIGFYPLTLTLGNVQTTIQVSVFNDQTQVNPEAGGDKTQAKVFINADSSYNVELSQTGNIKNTIAGLLHAKAWASDGTNLTDQINVTGLDSVTKVGRYPITLSATHNGKTATANAVVNVYDNNTATNDINKNQASVFLVSDPSYVLKVGNVDIFKEATAALLHAKAWSTKAASLDININFGTLVDKVGNYTISLSASEDGKTATKSVSVSVIDDDTTTGGGDKPENAKVFLVADKDISVKANEVETLKADFINKVHAKAWASDGTPLSIQDNAQTVVKNEVGSYVVTLTVEHNGSTATKQVVVNVTDDSTQGNETIAIQVNNVAYKIPANASKEDEQILIDAGAKAWNKTTGDDLTPKLKLNNGKAVRDATKPQAVKLNASVNGASASFVVSILDDNSETDNNGKPEDATVVLNASNFEVTTAEAKVLDNQQAKERAQVSAWDNKGNDLTPQVQPNTANLEQIKAGKAGTYDLTFTVGTVSKTVKVNVTDENTVNQGDIYLHGNSFNHPLSGVSQLTKEFIVEKGNISAWNKTTGAKVDVTLAPESLTDATVGPHTVKLTASQGDVTVTKDIIVSVYDDDSGNNGSDNNPDDATLFIDGDNSVELTVGDQVNTFNQDMVTGANIIAWNQQGTLPNTQISVEPTKVENQVGVTKLIYTVRDGQNTATKTVVVSVKDTTTQVDPETNIAIDAKNFNHPLAQASQLNEAKLKELAQVTAWNTKTGDDLTGQVKLTPNSLADKDQANFYKVVAQIPETNPTKEFVVNLYGEDTGTDQRPGEKPEEAQTFIRANNITTTLDQVTNLTKDSIKTDSQAYAWTSDGQVITGEIDVNQDDIDAIKRANTVGAYNVRLTVRQATKTIVVSVTDNNTDSSADSTLNISASDFTVGLAEAKNFSQAEAKTRAKVKAWFTNNVEPINNSEVTIEGFENITSAKVAGNVQITFVIEKDGQRASKQVNVTITDDLVYTIEANDFSIKDVEAKGDGFDAQQAKVLSKAKVMANGEDYSNEQLANVQVNSIQLQEIKKGNVGVYPLTLTLHGTITKTIHVSVYQDGTNMDPDADGDPAKAEVFIQADPSYNVELSQASNIKATIAGLLHAKAWAKDGTDLTNQINVTGLDSVTKVGRYPVVLSATYNSKTAKTNAVVNVYDNDTATDNTDKNQASVFLVSDPSIVLKVGKVDNFKKNATTLLHAKAWSTQTPSLNISTDFATLADEVGNYTITLSASEDGKTATKPVSVTVINDDTATGGGEPGKPDTAQIFLIADNVVDVKLNEVDAFKTDFINKVHANAWSIDGTLLKSNIKDDAQKVIKNEVGGYVVTLTVEHNGATATKQVVVNVIDDSVQGNDNVAIKVNNVAYKIPANASKDDAQILSDAGAKAWSKTTGADLTAQLKLDNGKAVRDAKKPQPVKLITSVDGANGNFLVSILDENSETDNNEKPENATVVLNASNFEVTIIEAKQLDDEQAKQRAQVSAWDNKGNNLNAQVKPDSSDLDTIKVGKPGTYDLTFTVGTVSKTVKVNVILQGTVVGNKATIYAQNFSIKLSKVRALDDEQAKALSEANAWNNDGSKPDPTIVVNVQELQAIQQATTAATLPLTFSVEGDDKATKQIQVIIINDQELIMPGIDDQTNTKDDVVVKPNPDNNGDYPEKDEDGSVTLPNGGTITIPGTDPDEDISVPNGSTIKPDGSIVTPNDQELLPQPNGGIELPGKDSQLDNKPDNPLVKPTPGTDGKGQIDVNENGSVTLPNGGNITFPNNSNNQGSIGVPNGSTIAPDGTITTPSGNQVSPDKDGNIELPGLDNKLDQNKDNPVINPDGTNNVEVNEDGSVVVPDGGTITFPNADNNNTIVKFPAGSTIKPSGVIVTPDNKEILPLPNGGVELRGNDGQITTHPETTPGSSDKDNLVITSQNGGVITVNSAGEVNIETGKDATITYPHSGSDTQIIIPDGSSVNEIGQVILPGQSVPSIDTESDGTLKVPGPEGQLGTTDDVVVTPTGNATIAPNGSITLPTGGSIKPNDGEGKEWPVVDNTIVNLDGSITLPGTNPDITFKPTIRPNGDGTISVPGPEGTFEADGNNDFKVQGDGITFDPQIGNVTLPYGGSVTKPGGQVVNVPNGAIVRPDGVIVIQSSGINSAPTIAIVDPQYDTATNSIKLPLFSSIDLTKVATASDVEDGDITNNLVIDVKVAQAKMTVNGAIDTAKPGVYDVTFSVVDNQQGKVTKTIKVIIENKIILPGVDNDLTADKDNPMIVPTQDAVKEEDGSISLPGGGTMTFPNDNTLTNITIPGGSIIQSNGMITTNGVSIMPASDGTLRIPATDGQLNTPDDGIVTPNGAVIINSDGSMVLPEGGKVDLPNNCSIEVKAGGMVQPNGVVINPGVDNTLNTNDDEVLDPSIVCATPSVAPTIKPDKQENNAETGAYTNIIMVIIMLILATSGLLVVRRQQR